MHCLQPSLLLSLLLLGSDALVNAAILNFHVRTPSLADPPSSSPFTRRSRHFARADSTNSSSLSSRSTIPVLNTLNAEYISNITLGGRTIPVLLDTGSSDLWVTGDVPGTKDLGTKVSLSYAVGTAAGDVNTADLTLNGFTVKDQAYLLVKDTSSFSLDIKSQGFEGLIGLGPNTGSTIRDDLDKGDAGDSVLSRIFSQNTTTQNYLTLLLDRKGDSSDPFTGQLSISEIVPGFENITTMPKLDVDKVHRLTDADQHWQTFTDVNGVIGPDGQPILIDSIVPKADDGELVVVFDSGFTLPQVPRKLSDAIYGRVQGAVYDETHGYWTVPCDQLINLSFKFGGIEYPIHPLDVVSSDFNILDKNGNPVCVGTFQPITSAFSLLGEYDIILGMAFMRNAYTLMDYGNWVAHSKNDRNDPFIQLLPLTNKQAAHDDFVKVRMGGVDKTGDASHALLPADQQKYSPVSSAEKKKMYEEKILSRWPYIFIGCLAFVAIVIGLIIWRCCVRRKRARAAAKAAKKLNLSLKVNTSSGSGMNAQNSYPDFGGAGNGGGNSTPMKEMSGGGHGYSNDQHYYQQQQPPPQYQQQQQQQQQYNYDADNYGYYPGKHV